MEETAPTIPPHTPPRPPRARFTALRSHTGLFAVALSKTLGVGVGLAILTVAAGLFFDLSQKRQCNVSVRTLHGVLTTYPVGGDAIDSGSLVRGLVRDENNEHIKAVVLDIDSPGGLPVAGEEVAGALVQFSKPDVAVIRSSGVSAAYWAASGADRIFASTNSDVGSIGVIVSFPDESEKNKKEGVSFNEFSSGKFKNLGTPTRPVTKDEQILLERDIKEIYENFVAAVSLARHLPIEKVRTLADGSSMTGTRAMAEGLVDENGGFEEARAYLTAQIGVPAVFCEPDSEELY